MAGLKILIGNNEDEGTKSLMYFLPSVFPNREMSQPSISKKEFSSAINKIYGDVSFVQVCDQ